MKDRIVKFIDYEKLTPAEFADKIGVQRSSVSHVVNGRNNPGFAFIQKILEAFPNLNSRWLLTGDGEMFENKVASIPINESSEPIVNDLFSTPAKAPAQVSEPKTVKTTEAVEPTSNQTEKVEAPTSTIVDKHNVPVKKEKRVVKVLIFYDDHTFEDFRPADNI